MRQIFHRIPNAELRPGNEHRKWWSLEIRQKIRRIVIVEGRYTWKGGWGDGVGCVEPGEMGECDRKSVAF
jgi:hypothetical protein